MEVRDMGKKRRALVILRKKGHRVAVHMRGEAGDVIPMLCHALARVLWESRKDGVTPGAIADEMRDILVEEMLACAKEEADGN
jgi:hypothetical protein